MHIMLSQLPSMFEIIPRSRVEDLNAHAGSNKHDEQSASSERGQLGLHEGAADRVRLSITTPAVTTVRYFWVA